MNDTSHPPSLHDHTRAEQEQTRQEDLECGGGGAKLSSSSCPSTFNDETPRTKSHNNLNHDSTSSSGLENLREIRATSSRMSSISEPSSITEDDQEEPSFLSDIDANFNRWDNNNSSNNNKNMDVSPACRAPHRGGGENESPSVMVKDDEEEPENFMMQSARAHHHDHKGIAESGETYGEKSKPTSARKRKRRVSSHGSRPRNSDEDGQQDEQPLNNLATATTTSSSDQKGSQTTEKINRAHAVRWIRRIFVVVLVCSTVAVAAAVYMYAASQERHQFVTQFDSDSEKLLANIGMNFDLTMGAADAFMLHVVAQARSSPQDWPMVPPLPDLAVQSAKLLSRTNSIYMAFYPLIQQQDRATWENFTRFNDDWVEKALASQARNPHFQFLNPNHTTIDPSVKSYSIWRNEGPEPADAKGPFLPSWMGSPVIPTAYSPFNWNALAYPAFSKGLMHTMETKSVVVTAVANHADPNDPVAEAHAAVTNDWAQPYMMDEDEMQYTHEPFSDMYYPVIMGDIDDVVIDTTGPNVTDALGSVAFSFYWRHSLKNLLPAQSTGLHIVFDNPCGDQHFTYQIDGQYPRFLGSEDLHQSTADYESMARSSSLADLTDRGGSYTGLPLSRDLCPFTLTIYPSTHMENKYRTKAPIFYSLGAALIFAFVAALFFAYDCLVRREFNTKHQLLEAKRHFMRFVSHEVQTPLNAVCLGLSVLQDEMNRTVVIQTVEDSNNGDASSFSHHDNNCRRNNASRLENVREVSQEGDSDDDIRPAKLQTLLSGHRQNLHGWLNLTREICDSAESSVDVLNDLLNHDKVSVGSFTMELTVFSVWQLLQETSREFRMSARRKNIHFVLDMALLKGGKVCDGLPDSFKIVGDRIRLAQVLRNLVSNALKFTQEQGHMVIQASWTRVQAPERQKLEKFTLKSGESVSFQRQGTIVIKVIDSGVGISEKQLQSLFHDGTQSNFNDLQAGKGSGLGLFISKGMVAQHGGELKASSAGLGCGSTFTIELPLYDIPVGADDGQPKRISSTSFRTVSSTLPPVAVDEPSASPLLLGRSPPPSPLSPSPQAMVVPESLHASIP